MLPPVHLPGCYPTLRVPSFTVRGVGRGEGQGLAKATHESVTSMTSLGPSIRTSGRDSLSSGLSLCEVRTGPGDLALALSLLLASSPFQSVPYGFGPTTAISSPFHRRRHPAPQSPVLGKPLRDEKVDEEVPRAHGSGDISRARGGWEQSLLGRGEKRANPLACSHTISTQEHNMNDRECPGVQGSNRTTRSPWKPRCDPALPVMGKWPPVFET